MIKSQIMKNETVQPNTRELEKLKEILPQYFDKEGNFKLDSFKEMLKLNEINVEKEGYELKFLGKNYSKFQSGLETETVIVPDIEHNSKEENINSENMYIVGDNLDALKHLLKSYSNKIKCIYIDPPYNTGSDGFVYNDNFSFTSEILSEKMGIDEEEAKKIIELRGKSNHSAWLTFMYSRIELARDLLTDDGVIFISIDDNEQANLKLMCDEIFGEENFIALLPTIMNLKGNQDEFGFAGTHEYTFVYAKNKEFLTLSELDIEEEELLEWNLDEKGYYKQGAGLVSTGTNSPRELRPNLWFPILIKEDKIVLPNIEIIKNLYNPLTKEFNDVFLKKYIEEQQKEGITVLLPYVKEREASWRWSYKKILLETDELILQKNKDKYTIYKKQRPSLSDLPSKKPKSIFYKPEYSSGNGTSELEKILEKERIFSNPKPFELLYDFFKIAIKQDSVVLDFFSGSATTAHAVMELNKEDNGNRKYIMVQLPEEIKEDKVAYKEGYRTIDEIGRERIKRVGEKIKEENPNVDYGFKLFRLKEVEQNMIDKIIEFDPEAPTLLVKDYIEAFKYENTTGKDTILTTWLNEDGYGLIVKSKKVKLINYEIDVYNNSAYIIEQGITSEDIIKLMEMIEDNNLSINRIVIYPYSIPFNIIHELKNNIKQLHVDVELIERY